MFAAKIEISIMSQFLTAYIISLFRQIDNSLNTLPKDKQYTYLVSDGRLYKIGKSKDVYSRINQLKTSNPLIELVHVIDKDVENMLHKQFANKSFSREWFNLSESDIKYIKSL